MRPIHLVRYGLPVAIAAAGGVVIVAGTNQISAAFGIVLIGVAWLVFVVNLFARLSICSQDDRDREDQARSEFQRRGTWRSPRSRADPHSER